MKRNFLVIAILCALYIVPLSLFAASNRQTVVLTCDLHCKACCDKVMKNIAFEKGIKDLVCDLDTKTVTVTYDANKTDVPTILKAFDKINKPAQIKQPAKAFGKEEPGAPIQELDAQSGASTPQK